MLDGQVCRLVQGVERGWTLSIPGSDHLVVSFCKRRDLAGAHVVASIFGAALVYGCCLKVPPSKHARPNDEDHSAEDLSVLEHTQQVAEFGRRSAAGLGLGDCVSAFVSFSWSGFSEAEDPGSWALTGILVPSFWKFTKPRGSFAAGLGSTCANVIVQLDLVPRVPHVEHAIVCYCTHDSNRYFDRCLACSKGCQSLTILRQRKNSQAVCCFTSASALQSNLEWWKQHL